MRLEVAGIGETLLALIAAVGSFAGVSAYVNSKAFLLSETRRTFTARIGPFTAMNPLVDPKVVFCGETPLALCTRKASRRCVPVCDVGDVPIGRSSYRIHHRNTASLRCASGCE